jgi:hypothetical protein
MHDGYGYCMSVCVGGSCLPREGSRVPPEQMLLDVSAVQLLRVAM